MKTRTVSSLINFSLCAAVLIAFAIPCAAVERPFKLQGTTVVLGNPFDPAGAQMQGNGTATHLGDWANSGVIFFDASSGPPFPVIVVVHFSAANGMHERQLFRVQCDAIKQRSLGFARFQAITGF